MLGLQSTRACEVPVARSDVLGYVVTGLGLLLLGLLLAAVITSLREGEARAARRALLLSAILPLPYLGVGLARFPGSTVLAAGLLILTLATVGILHRDT